MTTRATNSRDTLYLGKCSNKNWHGHNFELFVTVKGRPSEETGFVMNLKELRNRREALIGKLDGAAAVIAASNYQVRSNDTEFPFRQNSSFYYIINIYKISTFFSIFKYI